MKLKEKEISKADMKKKVEAWKTINSVLVSENAKFMSSLTNMLTEEEVKLKQLEEKLQQNSATEQDNAEYLFKGGYVQCLKDILNVNKNTKV